MPNKRKFGSKYGGKKYKCLFWTWGSSAWARLKRDGECLKISWISNYRILSSENVTTTKEKIEPVQDKIRRPWVLYVCQKILIYSRHA